MLIRTRTLGLHEPGVKTQEEHEPEGGEPACDVQTCATGAYVSHSVRTLMVRLTDGTFIENTRASQKKVLMSTRI